MLKIDGVVVLYNPDYSIIENIKSYINDIDKLYIIDNSEVKNKELINKIIKKFSNIEYMWLGENKGIAHALNRGAGLAIKDGAKWLLTMDQDSKFSENGLRNLKECLLKLKSNNINIGLVSPVHKNNKNSEFEKKLVVMTSGNIVNLDAYKDVGGFEEKLFIDAVDYDFCLRLNLAQYEVIECSHSRLEHQLGESKKINIFGKTITIFTHSPIRRYYMMRNALYFWKKYFFNFPLFIFREIVDFQRNWIEIALFSNKKLKDMKYLIYGILDFILSKYGKFNRGSRNGS